MTNRLRRESLNSNLQNEENRVEESAGGGDEDLRAKLMMSSVLERNPERRKVAREAVEAVELEAEKQMRVDEQEEVRRTKEALTVRDDDIVSVNFDHRKFELMDELKEVLDRGEELSPFEGRQVEQL